MLEALKGFMSLEDLQSMAPNDPKIKPYFQIFSQKIIKMTDKISFISIHKKIKTQGRDGFLSMSIRLVEKFKGIGFCDFTKSDYGSTYIIVNNMTKSQNAHIKAEYER